jgi:hypothetical protein
LKGTRIWEAWIYYIVSFFKIFFSQKKYFDFGSSNEEQGTKLNAGLSLWKEVLEQYCDS